MAISASYFAPALKQYYSSTKVENMTYVDHPFYAMLAKDESFYGENLPLPIIYANPQGRSADFTQAKANKNNSKLKKFLLERFADYSLASVANEVIEASENDKGAFLRALTTEIDGSMIAAINSKSRDLFGSGTGKIGRILTGTALAGTTISLDQVEDVVNFEVGMVLKSSAANGGGAVRAGSLTIVGVDRINGTVETSAALNVGIGAIADTDFLFVDGDYDSKMPGLLGWLPSTTPTAGDSFLGVDRSADPTRLGGIRIDASSVSVEEGLIDSASLVCREGGNPDVCLVSYDKYSELEKSLGSKVQYFFPQAYKRADISFRGIQLNHSKGFVTVIADTHCPTDRGFMLTMKSWKLYSLKKCIRILDLDGNRVLRDSDADSVELRVGGYSVPGCNAPGHNANIRLE